MKPLSEVKKSSLKEVVKNNCLSYGDFKLSSGIRSRYFLDGSKLWNSENLFLVTQCLYEVIDPFPHQIGGPSVGADPLVGAFLLYARMQGHGLDGFVVKKNGDIEGEFKPSFPPLPNGPTFRTIIIEDVVTTGNQVYKAAAIAEERGATVQGIVALVDRDAGASKLLSRWNYYPLLSVHDLDIKG